MMALTQGASQIQQKWRLNNMEKKTVWMIVKDGKVLSEDGNWVEFTNNRALRFQSAPFARDYITAKDVPREGIDGTVIEHIFDNSQMTTNTPIMKFFTFEHLPPKLKDVSQAFCQVAQFVDAHLAPGTEKAVCLRKLLEAKDAGVRAAI